MKLPFTNSDHWPTYQFLVAAAFLGLTQQALTSPSNWKPWAAVAGATLQTLFCLATMSPVTELWTLVKLPDPELDSWCNSVSMINCSHHQQVSRVSLSCLSHHHLRTFSLEKSEREPGTFCMLWIKISARISPFPIPSLFSLTQPCVTHVTNLDSGAFLDTSISRVCKNSHHPDHHPSHRCGCCVVVVVSFQGAQNQTIEENISSSVGGNFIGGGGEQEHYMSFY